MELGSENDVLPTAKELVDTAGTDVEFIKRKSNEVLKHLHKKHKKEYGNDWGTAFFNVNKPSQKAQRKNWKLSIAAGLADFLDSIDEPRPPVPEKEVGHLNMILYGPPGTGKTHSLRRKAVEIILGDQPESTDDEIKKKYDELVNEGQIRAVTFHQSFGYEQFIEGIMPVINEDGKDGETSIRYDLIPGVFKEFCDNTSPVTDYDQYGISSNPTVWKISLNGSGPNPIRKECFEKGLIRLGYGDK